MLKREREGIRRGIVGRRDKRSDIDVKEREKG